MSLVETKSFSIEIKLEIRNKKPSDKKIEFPICSKKNMDNTFSDRNKKGSDKNIQIFDINKKLSK